MVGEIRLAGSLSRIAVNPSTGRVYVNNGAPSQGLAVIDGSTQTIVRTIEGVGDGAVGVDSKRNLIFVPSVDEGHILTLSGDTNRVIGSSAVAHGDHEGIAISAGGSVFVTVDTEGQTAIVATNPRLGSAHHLETPTGPTALAIDRWLYATLVDQGSSKDPLLVIDPRSLKVEKREIVGAGPPMLFPERLVLNTTRTELFILLMDNSDGTGRLVRFDTRKQRIDGSLDLPSLPSGIAVDSERGVVYVTSSVSNSLWLIGSESLQMKETIRLPMPVDVAVDQSSHAVYVAGEKGTVSVLQWR